MVWAAHHTYSTYCTVFSTLTPMRLHYCHQSWFQWIQFLLILRISKFHCMMQSNVILCHLFTWTWWVCDLKGEQFQVQSLLFCRITKTAQDNTVWGKVNRQWLGETLALEKNEPSTFHEHGIPLSAVTSKEYPTIELWVWRENIQSVESSPLRQYNDTLRNLSSV